VKVLIVHNDLRVYWKRRLYFLKSFLLSKGIELHVVELFGKGSPYVFDPYNSDENWWTCLFPDNHDNELSKKTIKKALFNKFSEVNPDIVIGGSIVFYSGALGLRWAKNHGKKFIMFDDAKPSNVKRSRYVQRIKDIITGEIDALWLPSRDYFAEYGALYSQQDIHFFYGYNTIDNKQFQPKEAKRFDNRKIICVARLVPIKNLANLLRAWKSVEDLNTGNELIILGDGNLLDELKGLTSKFGLHYVRFLGAQPNSSIPQYLMDADAFVLPSWSESWGLVVNEAMASGLPVLLSDKVNAADTLLKDGVNGFRFSPSNVSDISEKLKKFIQLSERDKKQMSENSLKIISEMSFENMGSELLETLLLLKEKRNKRIPPVAYALINLWYGRYNTLGWDYNKV
jgi:glycosyltransferase involved in cell wall biosynthesis